jgi:2-polyprenyl-3-methyl-5-hydroxy-6-metoxy-1,4-benzoquinol methylase
MTRCRLCQAADLATAIDFGPMPIAHRMRRRRDETETRYPLKELVCRQCGLVQIADPIDPEDLYREFNYCFSGWKPQPHIAAELAMIQADAPGPRMLEIGSNDGLFLGEARKAGFAPLLGIEPNRVATDAARELGLEIVNEMLTPALAADLATRHGRFDTIVLRQVLEHLTDLAGFFRSAEILLAPEGVLFVDVPDCEQGFARGDVTMMWEEHVNSFTEATLEATLARFGFGIVRRECYNYSGGTIAVCAKRSAAPQSGLDLAMHLASVDTYEARARAIREKLRALLRHARASGHAIALYGAGNRACTFSNWAEIGPFVDYAIDDQAERQGLFMPGTGIAVCASTTLAEEERPVLCMLAVNTENDDAVTAKVLRLARHEAIVFSVLSPKDIAAELDRAAARLAGKIAT